MRNIISEETAQQIIDGAILAMNGKRVLLSFESPWVAKKMYDIAFQTSTLMYDSLGSDDKELTIVYEDGGVLIFGTEKTLTNVQETISIR
jgi:hypothetical protein